MTWPRGSEWRRWDLHVHTPASFDWRGGPTLRDVAGTAQDDLLEMCLRTMQATEVAVFAVQDHWTFDGYDALRDYVASGRAPWFTKTLLPGIELRVEAPMKEKANFHVLFSNSVEAARRDVFLKNLKMINGFPPTREGFTAFAADMDAGKKREFMGAGSVDDQRLFEVGVGKAKVTRESLLGALEAFDKRDYLILLPWSTSGGLKGLDWKVHPGEDMWFLRGAHMLETRDQEDFDLFTGKGVPEKAVVSAEVLDAIGGRPKPCYAGTDAHEFAKYGVFPSNRVTWIKADPTFSGLRQACVEPQERVFIGEVPSKLEDVRRRPTKHISSVRIQKLATSDLNEKWFQCELELNPGLVAVIGNKGAGKSALTDVLALLGNAHDERLGFLSKDRFRIPPSRGAHFKAEIAWESGETSSCDLDDDPDLLKPARVKYLAQNRIEELCNEIRREGRDSAFEGELRKVAFSHIPQAERMGAQSLDDLINLRSDDALATLKGLRADLSRLNRTIVTLERRLAPRERDELVKTLAHLQQELDAHAKTRPESVDLPAQGADPETQVAQETLTRLQTRRDELAASTQSAEKRRAEATTGIAAVNRLSTRIRVFTESFEKLVADTAQDAATVGINVREAVRLNVDTSPITRARQKFDAEVQAAVTDIGDGSTQGLRFKIANVDAELASVRQRLDAPMLRYQKFQEDLRVWQAACERLTGAADTPNTIAYCQARLAELDTVVPNALAEQQRARRDIAAKILVQIERLKAVKRDLLGPVQSVIDAAGADGRGLKLKFIVGVSVHRFAEHFFEFVNQAKRGSFRGDDAREGWKRLTELLQTHSFESTAGALTFLDELMRHLTADLRDDPPPPVRVEDQLKKNADVVQFYDFIFGLEYMRPYFTLALDDRPIDLLSPGEKGALLIVFYLLLDPDDVPLLIDQPEHNLDNESVYKLLVPRFRDARRKRQVIVVTHNPNLAVVCDAEQVVHAEMFKNDGNRISYTSGSIEDLTMNKRLVDVLEGTWPAFENRDRKYLGTV